MPINKKYQNKTYQFPDGTTDEQINAFFETLPEKETPQSGEKRGLLTDISLGAVDGVRDGVQATIGLVEGIGDTLGEKTNIGGFIFGDEAENGFMEYVSYDEFKERGLKDPLFGKAGEQDAIQLPDFEKDPDTIAGNLTKGVSQFLTGWFTGGKLLKGVKATTGTGQLAKSVARGSIADFQAFDENTGRLVDIITDQAPDLNNPLFEYLSSDPDDTFYEARFKNALEGAGLGGALEGTFRAFRWYKNKKAQANNEKFNKKQLEEDEKTLSSIKEEEIVLNKYKPLPEKLETEVVKNLEKDLEDSIFLGFKDAQKNTKNVGDFNKAIEDLDLSTNFNIRQMVNMDQEGLLSLDAFEKAYSKLIKEKKIVLTDEMVERQARKMYENKSGVLEADILELRDVVKQAPAKVVALNSYLTFLQSSMKRMARISTKEPKAKTLLTRVLLPKYKLMREAKLGIRSDFARTQRLSATSFDTQVAKDMDATIKEFEEYGGDIDEFIKKIGASGDADLTTVFKAVSNNRTWDIANEVWINALLSNPKTHIINVTSTLMNVFVRPLEKMIGSQLTTKLLENPQKVNALRNEFQPALSTYAGMGRYLKDSIKYSALALKKEDTILTSRTKLETPRKSIQKTKLVEGVETIDNSSLSGKFINNLGKVIRLPSRFLNAEDEFAKQIVYRAELEKDGIRRAIKNGLSKDKIVATDWRTRKPISEFEQFVIEHFESGFDDFGRATKSDILEKAERGTYTNQVTGIFKRIADTTNEYPILKQILPFTRTPVNLMLNVVDRTPLGFIRREVRDDFFGRNGAEKMAQARGQMALGMSLMVYASYLYRNGHITGVQGQLSGEKLSKSKEFRDLRRSTGRVPYAYRYFDEESQTYKYREFGRFDPFGAFFGMVADYHAFYDKLTEEEIERVGSNILLHTYRMGGDVSDYINPTTKITNSISAGFSAITRNLASKTYLKGLADFMEVITSDDPNKVDRYARSKVGSFVPNIYTKFINDPFYRDTESIFDEVKRRTGTAEIEFRYDFRGNALKIQGTETERLINGMFNPFTLNKQTTDPVLEEVLRLGINFPSMKETLRGDIDLRLFTNSKGQTAYNRQQELLRKIRIGNKSLNKALLEAINSNQYKQLSDPRNIDKLNKDIGGRAKLLRSIIKDYHTAVEEQIIKEAKTFTSTKDDTGKFTLLNSINSVNNNSNKLKLGLEIKPTDLDELYQFSK